MRMDGPINGFKVIEDPDCPPHTAWLKSETEIVIHPRTRRRFWWLRALRGLRKAFGLH